MTADYTETFAKFILSAREQYDALVSRIEAGEIPGDSGVQVTIEIPAVDVDAIRFDCLAAIASEHDDG